MYQINEYVSRELPIDMLMFLLILFKVVAVIHNVISK